MDKSEKQRVLFNKRDFIFFSGVCSCLPNYHIDSLMATTIEG